LFFLQSKWYFGSYLVMFLSILAYFGSVSFISSIVYLDPNFYDVWFKLMSNPSFWLSVLLLTTLVVAKDVYISGLERNFNFKPAHIIQEMELNGTMGEEECKGEGEVAEEDQGEEEDDPKVNLMSIELQHKG
ncbi:hypothetical protein B484DRAFT_438800, partial [Ochromonadaceae sp. CCMP2298]